MPLPRPGLAAAATDGRARVPRRLLLRAIAAAGVVGLGTEAGAQTAAAPVLRGRTSGGDPLDLKQLRGAVVLLFAWSTTCPVCLDKWPELRRNLDGWAGKPFHVVALNLDPGPEPLRDWLRAVALTTAPSPQLVHLWRGDPAHQDDLGDLPPRTPTLLVLDKSGRRVQQHRGRMPAELWDTVAERVLT